MKNRLFLFFVILPFFSKAQNGGVKYIIFKDNQMIDAYESLVHIYISYNDSTFYFYGNTGDIVLNNLCEQSSTDSFENDSLSIKIQISSLSGRKQKSYLGFLKREELSNARLVVLNIKSRELKYNIEHKIYQYGTNLNYSFQQTYFAIDGTICYDVDSILFCNGVDSSRLFYDFGALGVDPIRVSHKRNEYSGMKPTVLLYTSRKCYEIPYCKTGNDIWYVFIRNIARDKYTVGWNAGSLLCYKKIADLRGRKGAFH